jgi:hypothetical protein
MVGNYREVTQLVGPRLMSSSIVSYLSMGLEWNQVHYYCDHLLIYCTSSVQQMAMIVEQLVK